MADRVQRPRRVETFGGDCYAPKLTEAYMDHLETELRDTRRAVEIMCDDFNILEIHASQKFPSTVDDYLNAALRERTDEEIKVKLGE